MPERAVVFLLTVGLVVVYAIRGGTYDLVPRQELGLALWWVLGLGIALGILPRSRPSREFGVTLAGFVVLLVVALLAYRSTESDERTSVELARTVHHLGLLLFVAAVVSRRSWSAAVGGVACGAALVVGLALVSRLLPDLFPQDQVRAAFGGARLNYPLNYWNAVGAWAALTSTMLLAWSAHAHRTSLRLLALVTVPAALVTAYLTYSRASLLAVVVGAIVAIVFSSRRVVVAFHALAASAGAAMTILVVRAHPDIADARGANGAGYVVLSLVAAGALCIGAAILVSRASVRAAWHPSARVRRVALATAVVAVLVGALALLPAPLSRAWHSFQSPVIAAGPDPAARLGDLSGTRYEVWGSALESFRQKPSRGTGPGTFEFWWNRDGRNPEFVRDAHSLELESLAETGWPGLLGVMLVILGGLATVLAARKRPGTGNLGAAVAAIGGLSVWLLSSAVDWMWEATANTALALMLIGAAAVANRPPVVPGAVFRVVGPLFALAAIAVQLPVLVSTSAVRASQREMPGNPARALADATDGVNAQPWAAFPYVQRGLILEATGDLRAAEADIEHAMRREPTNWRHPLLLARIAAERGRPKEALRFFRLARELRPRGSLTRVGG
jgi:hypothetical protein